MRVITLAVAAAIALLGPAARAACPTPNTVPVKSLTAGFQAWKSVTAAMSACGNVQAELDQEFGNKEPAAFGANPALYQIGAVANETMVPLATAGTIRPLDDLVAKYGQQLKPSQLIKVGGKTMAIAMDVNAQHLWYRSDVLDQLHIAVPTTYDEMLAAAEKIRAAGVMKYPVGATMKSGWNLGEDFVNMYEGTGAPFLDAGNHPKIDGAAGLLALETMKKLTAYMDPDFLTCDSTCLQTKFQKGQVALANFWGSRAGAMDDAKESQVVGKVKFAAAPMLKAGGKPASTIWWDGAVIARNATDEQATAAFKVLMVGFGRDMVQQHNDDVVWLIDGYKPAAAATGVLATLKEGAPSYPASPAFLLLHAAAGNSLGDYLAGRASAQETLAKIDAAYTVSAKEKGLLQ